MRSYLKTFSAIWSPLLKHWRELMGLVLSELLTLVLFALHATAPNAPLTVVLGALPNEAYLSAGAFFVVVALFLVLHDIRKQRDELRRVANYESALDGLGVLFDKGTQILNLTVSSDTEFGQWAMAWGQWRDEVEGYLSENFGPRERYLFRNSVLVEHYLADGFNDDHKRQRNQIVRKLEILRDMIVRHCDQASLWRSKAE